MLVGVIVFQTFVFMCGQLFTSIIVASWWIDILYNTRSYYSRLFTSGNQGRLIVVQFAKSLQPEFYMLLILCDSGVSLCWLVYLYWNRAFFMCGQLFTSIIVASC